MSVVLPSQIQTLEQLSEAVVEVRAYLNKLHDRTIRQQVTGAQDEVMPSLSPLLKSLFEASAVALTDQPAIKLLLTELEETRITAPRMRIMLPAWPDATIREQLVMHIRRSIHPLTMLSFAVRADMGGGCIVQAGSKRFDFSFQGQLLANKHKISELLHSYAKA